jgi:hypothetical protein
MELVELQWRSLLYGAVSMAVGFSFGVVSLLGGCVIAAGGYRSPYCARRGPHDGEFGSDVAYPWPPRRRVVGSPASVVDGS